MRENQKIFRFFQEKISDFKFLNDFFDFFQTLFCKQLFTVKAVFSLFQIPLDKCLKLCYNSMAESVFYPVFGGEKSG